MKMDGKMDIFDKIMALPGLRVFEPFYKKYKEALLYLFFGGLAFFLNIWLFWFFDAVLGLNALVSNVICWVMCVLFQFFTNRTWVFDGKTEGMAEFLKQMGSFFGSRVFTLIVEEVILAIFITGLGWKTMAVKLAAQVIVIILNYIFSKLIVFRK